LKKEKKSWPELKKELEFKAVKIAILPLSSGEDSQPACVTKVMKKRRTKGTKRRGKEYNLLNMVTEKRIETKMVFGIQPLPYLSGGSKKKRVHRTMEK